MQVVSVIIEYSDDRLNKSFDYLYYGKDDIKGKRVKIEFNHRLIIGYVVNSFVSDKTKLELESEYGFKLNEIKEVIDNESLVNEELFSLAQYMSNKYISSLISCLNVMLPKALKSKSVKNIPIRYLLGYRYIKDVEGLTSKQKEVLDIIKDKGVILSKDINCSKCVIDSLLDKGCIVKKNVEKYRDVNYIDNSSYQDYKLTKDQQSVYDSVISGSESVYLLEGVTGSGKSEVYFNLAKHYFNLNKSIIILVPEIILTGQIASRFKAYFKDKLALLHSNLSQGEKYDEYRRIKKGEVKVVIGTRSAIFAPLDNIGLIVIDEEHSESYKQDSSPSYDTIEIAKIRIDSHNAKLVLGSATPSLETKIRANKGIYKQLYLLNRINNKGLPIVKIVDMNKENNEYFSKELIELINDRLDKKEQVIILINRRGYAPYVRCKKCGYVYRCSSCGVSMNYHLFDNKVKCHYCGKEYVLDKCEECNSSFFEKSGVGSQKIEELLKELFIGARILRMDLDTTKRKNAHLEHVNKIRNKEIDIIVGTQMVAKGLDFPNVTLVAVLNIDSSLNASDFRAKERAYQLLVQVLGRSGRSDKEGIALIQTYKSDNQLLIDASNYDCKMFYDKEISYRKKMEYPPFRNIAYMLFVSSDYNKVYKLCKDTKLYLDNLNLKEFETLGPSVPYIAKINNEYRIKLMIKYRDSNKAIEIFKQIKEVNLKNRNVKINIVINPSNDI